MFTAHGVGGAQDLPIPASYAVAGAGLALTVSFVVLLVSWKQPRFDGGTHGSPLSTRVASAIDSRWTAIAARVLGLLIFSYILWVGLWGPDLLVNPIFGIVYVLLWVGLVPASLLLGPIWRAMSPVRAIHAGLIRATGAVSAKGVFQLPRWVGYWPATVGLFAFVWMELVYENSTYLGPLMLWLAIYFVSALLGALLWGEQWIERADPFEVYSTLISHLSPIGRLRDGRLAVQAPLEHLDSLRTSPSRLGVVSVLLGSTAYDSFSRSPPWQDFTQWAGIDALLLGTLILLAFCAFVALTFAVASMLTALPKRATRPQLPGLYVHSVVPIIVGYVVAHYLSLLVEYGQQVVIQLSDPMVNGSNLFGTADWEVNYFLSDRPSTLAMIKVLAVLTGHVAGAVAAHDRATKLLRREHQATGQLALMLVMVIYTVGGLYLLFNG